MTSFIMGVKIGKNYFLDQAGISTEDQKKVVELLSEKEETLQEIKKSPDAAKIESSEIENKLQEKISAEFGVVENPHMSQSSTENHSQAPATTGHGTTEATSSSKDDGLSGKYTIQLGSHRSLREAEAFAEGFRARGYNPIINQIEIKGRGTWFRVSLEAFDSQEEARAYVQKEKTLFMGQDYNIIKMP